MGELKFRAWVKCEKRMVDVENIDFSVKTIWSPIKLDSIPHHFDFSEIELMQYIGLKDKNGKEIYDGDIVKDKYGVYVVVYGEHDIDCCGCCFKYHKTIGFYLKGRNEDEDTFDDIEVIGNIYENPELVGGKNE